MKKIGPLVLCLSTLLSAQAQEQGRVRLFVDPGDDFRFVLDRKYDLQQRELTLSPGEHHFTFWAPEHAMVDTTVTVIADSLTYFTLRLPLSQEFIDHKRELQAFRRKQMLTRSLPALATVGLGIWTAAQYGAYRKAYDDLQDLESSYADLQSPRAIDQLKNEEIPAAKDDFQRKRNTLYVAGGLFAAGIAGTLYVFRRTAHREIPVFQDKERLRFEGLVWLPGPQGGTLSGGLTWMIR